MTSKAALKKDRRGRAFFRENRYVLLSGLIALLITQIAAIRLHLVPYGDMTLLRIDLYHQFGPLFAELYDRLSGGASLVYSWNSGLGSSFLGNYYNYLSSPLSLLILLFGHRNMAEAISFFVMLKAILSAMSFSYYLKQSNRVNTPLLSGFGVLYAFCGFFVSYYWCVMWLDAMVLFPLILLGLERIIDRGRPALYCAGLALMIFANYYMAYMICIFSALYFFVYYFSHYERDSQFGLVIRREEGWKRLSNSRFFRSFARFALFSVVAANLAAVVLLPVAAVLSGSSATSDSQPRHLLAFFDLIGFLARHISGARTTTWGSGYGVLPNVSCGVLTLILLPIYLLSKKIPLREKIAHGLLLVFLYLSFCINFLNFFWHGFHFPNDLPFRFSFMYSFLLLSMAFKAFCEVKEHSRKALLAAGLFPVLLILLVKFLGSGQAGGKALVFSLGLAAAYVLALLLYLRAGSRPVVACVLLLGLIFSETAAVTASKIPVDQAKTAYVADYDDFRELKSQLDAREDGGFYRMEMTRTHTRMDPCWYGYNGVSVFSSMANEQTAKVQRALGLRGNDMNSYVYRSQTPVYNALFSLRYLVDRDGEELSGLYCTPAASSGDFTAWENAYCLPVAFAADSGLLKWDAAAYEDPFQAQSELFRMAGGAGEMFDRLEIEGVEYENIKEFKDVELASGQFIYYKVEEEAAGSIRFEITPERRENVFLYISSLHLERVLVSTPSGTRELGTLFEPYIVDLGVWDAGESISVTLDIKAESQAGRLRFLACTMNGEKFREGFEKLNRGGLAVREYSDTGLAGTLRAEKDGVVFTSIPYDESWEVTVDGTKLCAEELLSISGAFLGFPIRAGEHQISLHYRARGLAAGVCVSCVTLALCVGLALLRRRRGGKSKWDLP